MPSDILGLRLSVTPARFNAEMRYLRNHNFQSVTITQLANHIRYGTALPAKCVALTFDDGYEDQYTNALPILLRYGLRATFFIVSGFANQPRYMTWSQVRAVDRGWHGNWSTHNPSSRSNYANPMAGLARDSPKQNRDRAAFGSCCLVLRIPKWKV